MPYVSLWEKHKIHSATWVSSSNQLADCLTKEGAPRGKLCDVLSGNTNNNIY